MRVIFVGPELDFEENDGEADLKECPKCFKLEKSMRYETHKVLYKDYCNSKAFKKPDLIACFNCGFHEFEGENNTWNKSLQFLVRDRNVPLIFTSYTSSEAIKDLNLIKNVKTDLKILSKAEPNPFRSHRPFRDFEGVDGDIFYSHNYYSIVIPLL